MTLYTCYHNDNNSANIWCGTELCISSTVVNFTIVSQNGGTQQPHVQVVAELLLASYPGIPRAPPPAVGMPGYEARVLEIFPVTILLLKY